MIDKLVYIFLLLLVCCTHRAAMASSYANLFETGRALLVIKSQSVTIGDLEFPAHRCRQDEKFECVISTSFRFSVPKGIDARKEWNHLGARYQALANRQIILRGELIEYQLIRQTISESVVDFLYSDQLGVIGVKAADGVDLMLLEECGFAATRPRVSPYVNCAVP